MPLYEYVCRSCGQPFERIVSFSQADHAQACPNCRSDETERKLSTFAVASAGGSATSAPVTRPTRSPFS